MTSRQVGRNIRPLSVSLASAQSRIESDSKNQETRRLEARGFLSGKVDLGILCLNNGLLWGIVACYLGYLDFQVCWKDPRQKEPQPAFRVSSCQVWLVPSEEQKAAYKKAGFFA